MSVEIGYEKVNKLLKKNTIQSSQTDMAKAAELVEGTMKTLQQFSSDKEWSKLYKYVNDVASLLNNEVSPIDRRLQHSK